MVGDSVTTGQMANGGPVSKLLPVLFAIASVLAFVSCEENRPPTSTPPPAPPREREVVATVSKTIGHRDNIYISRRWGIQVFDVSYSEQPEICGIGKFTLDADLPCWIPY